MRLGAKFDVAIRGLPVPKSSSSAALRLASYKDIQQVIRDYITIKTGFTRTTGSGKFAILATCMPKLWSETPNVLISTCEQFKGKKVHQVLLCKVM